MTQLVPIGKPDDFPPGQIRVVDADGTSVIIVGLDGQWYGIANKCPHLGLPLAGGKLDGHVITCPFHNSRFDVCTGQNLDWVTGVVGIQMPHWVRRIVALGKQPHSVTAYPVHYKDGQLFIEK